MGLFDSILRRRRPTTTGRVLVSSPWSGSNLARVTHDEMAGLTTTVIDRSRAMKVPAVAKARALICGTLSRFPLAVWKGEERATTPEWMTSTSTSGMSPQARIQWTLDDLLFNGAALWVLQRKGDQIVDALRLPPSLWDIDPDTGLVTVDGSTPNPSEVCLIEGPQEGLTQIAADTITGALDLEAAWMQRVASPVPVINLKQTDNTMHLESDEVKELVNEWEQARRGGGTAFTPYGIQADEMGSGEADLFISGRNALRLDIANFTNVPGALLEGSTSTASLTYSTQEGQRNELVDFSLAYWATPIEARLSQDDILEPGLQCTFDLEWLATPVQTGRGPKWED